MVSTLSRAAQFRAIVAADSRPAYVIAAEIGVHPSRLSQYLRGHLPIPEEVAEKIRRVVNVEPAR